MTDDLHMCVYQEREIWRNVTVIVSECPECGRVDISWLRQDDTERIDADDV